MIKKLFIICALTSFANFASASTGETKTFTFTGGQSSQTLDLRGELTHTETRQEQVLSTCYREVLSHYSSVCYSVPRQRCDRFSSFSFEGFVGLFLNTAQAAQRPPGVGKAPRPPGGGPGGGGGGHPGGGPGGGHPGGGPGGGHPGGGPGGGPRPPQCHTVYVQECRQEPVYRTESYSCYKTHTVSYEVKDADVLAHVNVEFDDVPSQTNPNDTFTVTLRGTNVALSSTGSNQVVYVLEKSQQTDGQSNGLIETTVNYNVSMVSSAVLNAPVSQGLNGLTANSNAVSFTIGEVSLPETLKVALKIKKKKTFADKKLIERDLNSQEYSLVTDAGKTKVEIQTSALGLSSPLQDGKFEITATVKLNVNGQIANPSAVSKSTLERTIEVKLK